MKDAYYFSHDVNARRDPKILALRSEHGNEGYGNYWIIVEMLAEQSDYKLKYTKWAINAISMEINLGPEQTETFIESLINDYELLVTDGEYFWSESLLRRMNIKDEKRQKRAEAAKKGAEAKWKKYNEELNQIESIANAEQTHSNSIANAEQTHSNSIANAEQEQCLSNAIYAKVKESKVKENNIYSAFFEECWRLYPNKLGKSKISDTKKKEIYKLGDEFKRCISRYIKDVEKRRKNGFKDLKYQNGSTFFNGGYVDYLDKNYQNKVEADIKEPYVPKFIFRDL